jgi:CheY-like chemotaxis protein
MAKKILVVDNDADFVEAMTTLLETHGYTVVSASDGEAGFDLAKKAKPDAVMLDVMMRHVSEGLDVAVKLRDDKATKNIPVVLITGIRKPDFLTSSYRPGEDWPNLKATLEKPVRPEDIIAILADIVK